MYLIQYLYANGVKDHENYRYNPPHSDKPMMTASRRLSENKILERLSSDGFQKKFKLS